MVKAKTTSKHTRAGKSNKQYQAGEIITGSQTWVGKGAKQRDYKRTSDSCQQYQARSHGGDDAKCELISISFGLRLPGIGIIARILRISVCRSIPLVSLIAWI